jgi:eukaryotic-like serine/threonine-protein kinase
MLAGYGRDGVGSGHSVLGAGSIVGGYRILRVLGSGGMGAVYLAQSPSLPRYDAVKVLSEDLSRDPSFRTRFIREADVAAQLNHPNIVRVYNRGETETGALWIAMQYIDGTDADAALSAGAMTAGRAVRIVAEVARALDFAHQRGVVHRDVKPANFLLSTTDDPERVLLGDFGIARALDDVSLTVSGAVMATVAYAAPEVIASQPFDGRADLYSLGCTLFRLITGKTPFTATNGMAGVMAAHLYQPPPRVTDVAPALPPALNEVIAIALAKDPARRFQSGRDLATAAANALDDRTSPVHVAWRPVPSGEVTSYPRQGTGDEHPWWQQTGGARTAMASPVDQRTPAAPSEQRGRRGQRRVVWSLAALSVVVVLVAVSLIVIQLRHDPGAGTPQAATTTAQPPSTSAPPTPALVPVSDLLSLLLPLSAIRDTANDQALIIKDATTAAFDVSSTLPNDPQCANAYAPVQQVALNGSGYLGLQYQLIINPGELTKTYAQSVIAFPTVESATQFMQTAKQQWEKCANRRVALTISPPLDHEDFGTVTTTPDGFVIMPMTRGANVLQYGQRVLGQRNNIVIDTQVIGMTKNDQAVQIAQQIATLIPTRG